MRRRQARPMGAQLFPPAGQGFCRGLYKAPQSRWRSVNVGPPGGEEGNQRGQRGWMAFRKPLSERLSCKKTKNKKKQQKDSKATKPKKTRNEN